MQALLSTYGSRGDVEPRVGLAELLAGVGAPPVSRATRPSADLPPRAAELVAARFDAVAAAAEEWDAPVATGVLPTGGWR